jgi:hypothetical protein
MKIRLESLELLPVDERARELFYNAGYTLI